MGIDKGAKVTRYGLLYLSLDTDLKPSPGPRNLIYSCALRSRFALWCLAIAQPFYEIPFLCVWTINSTKKKDNKLYGQRYNIKPIEVLAYLSSPERSPRLQTPAPASHPTPNSWLVPSTPKQKKPPTKKNNACIIPGPSTNQRDNTVMLPARTWRKP